jgi:hypothetical protein
LQDLRDFCGSKQKGRRKAGLFSVLIGAISTWQQPGRPS